VDNPIILSLPKVGMRMVHPSQSQPTFFSLLVNGNIQSISNSFALITNELSNQLCSRFKPGFKVVNVQPVISLNLTFYFLVNPSTGQSEIGIIYGSVNKELPDKESFCKSCPQGIVEDTPLEQQVQEETCQYATYVSASCLAFDINHPVKSWVKVDDCNVRLYFTDDTDTGLRYIDYNDYQKVDILTCPRVTTDELDCDKIKIFKEACYPRISYADIVSGGQNTAGVYQFSIAYADASSNPLTQYYYTTSPIPLGDNPIVSPADPHYPVAKSIKLHIDGLNTDFSYFNLVVLKTVNGNTTSYLVGTFANSTSSFNYIYSGIDKNLLKDVSVDELLKRTPVYTKGKGIGESNGYLFFYDLEEPRTINLQPVINKLSLTWQTVILDEGDYKNPILAANYKSYLRDEVYPFAIEFTRINSPATPRFHIPGREATPDDLIDVSEVIINGSLVTNPDVFDSSACGTSPSGHPKWTVYNTGTSSESGRVCIEETPSGAPLVTITDTQECLGDILYMVTTSDTATPTFYSDPEGTHPLTISIHPEDNDGYSCTCENFAPTYPPSAVIVASDLDLINPNDPNLGYNSSIQIITPQQTIYNNVYEQEPKPDIPKPIGFPSSTDPRPCGGDWEEWYDAKTNITADSAAPLYQNTTNVCDSNLRTLGSFIWKDMQTTPPTESWYSFTNTNVDGVVGIFFSYVNNGGGGGAPQNVTIDFYKDDGVTPISPTYIHTTTSGKYIFFQFNNPSDLGKTYLIKVYGEAKQGGTGVSCKDATFTLCLVTPKPKSTTVTITPAVVQLLTVCTITYQGVPENNCVAQPYKYGEFSYWESTETYPCNEELYGELAGKPIRHHKFPDCAIIEHFDNRTISSTPKDRFLVKDKIYPIGVTVDVNQVKQLLLEAVATGLMTEEERLSICGYRILRGNRRGNESIVAKGNLYDVWAYKDNVYKSGKDILYANYPYNDRSPDPFLKKSKIKNRNDINLSPPTFINHPDPSNFTNNRYVFHGANTSYNNPGLGEELKLELELFGTSEGRYSQVNNHAKYQYVGTGMLQAALGFSTVETYVEATNMVLQTTSNYAVLGSYVSLNWILALVGANLASPGLIFNHYYEWLELLTKFAPFRNYAWYYTSVGNYSNFNTTNIIEGNIRRRLNDAQYLKQGIYNVQSAVGRYAKFNNIKRESSVYLNTQGLNFQPTSVEDDSRWYPGEGSISCNNLGYEYNNISSYYGSIKNTVYSQYGQLNTIDYIDTGYNGVIDWNDNNQDTLCDPIFGGDTFICRDWYRRQMSYFLDDNVGGSPNSDIVYSELGNVGYPLFFMNYPVGADGGDGKSAIYGNVAQQTTSSIDYNFSCVGDTGHSIYTAGLTFGILGAIGAGIGAIIGIPITYGVLAGTAATMSDTNTDVYLKGRFFLYSYGEPGFITESDYNLDLRNGEPGAKHKDFYPNVGDMVTWTQPTGDYNLINYDNTYFYNRDYSKQNKENFGYTLRTDYSQDKEICKSQHPNRLIYSLRDNDNNDRFDGNLVFLANNFYDFPKSGGKLKLVFGSNSGKVVVLQEDQCSIFNSYITQENQEILQATVGSNQIFNPNIPSQYIKTDLGYAGSQTSSFVSTEFGSFWVDNKRGQIFNYAENISNIIPEDNAWWFKENLPFQILKYFPEVDVDNAFKYFGMAIAYNQRLKTILFTKKDYKPLLEFKDRIKYSNNTFILDNTTTIEPINSKYFCNCSWTIGYSVLQKEFISFYTYIPNFYTSLNGYFSSGNNYAEDESELGLWNHGLIYNSFCSFYGKISPFMLEYAVNGYSSKIFESLSYNCEFRRYTNNLNYSVKNDITFNKLTIYNQNQTSGLLNLVVQEPNNLYQVIQYPKQSINSTDILVKNVENNWRVNQFFDVSLQNGYPLMEYECNPMYTNVNLKAISYNPTFFKNRLRNDNFLVRLTNDKYTNYQIVFKFSIEQQSDSKI
jgi:hypothetical protein